MTEPVTPPEPNADLLKAQQDLEAQRTQSLAQALENARLKAQISFPKANPELIAMFQGSPEQIAAFAQKLHESTPDPTPTVAPVAPASDPGMAPIPQPAAAASQGQVEQAKYNGLKEKVRRGYADFNERVEFRDLAFVKGWNSLMAMRKAKKGATA
jgi:hypothetical protein